MVTEMKRWLVKQKWKQWVSFLKECADYTGMKKPCAITHNVK